jgi:hypothetical protein
VFRDCSNRAAHPYALAEEESDVGWLDETAASLRAALSKAMRAPSPADELTFAEQDHGGESKRRCAKVAGFSLHAGQTTEAEDRDALERLSRYGSRAPFSQERLSLLPDGRVLDELPRPWPNSAGVDRLVLSPLDFLRRLAALLPASYLNLTRYPGCFASHSKHRALLPAPPPRVLPEGVESSPAQGAGCIFRGRGFAGG